MIKGIDFHSLYQFHNTLFESQTVYLLGEVYLISSHIQSLIFHLHHDIADWVKWYFQGINAISFLLKSIFKVKFYNSISASWLVETSGYLYHKLYRICLSSKSTDIANDGEGRMAGLFTPTCLACLPDMTSLLMPYSSIIEQVSGYSKLHPFQIPPLTLQNESFIVKWFTY